jgi:hypothetical protein
MRLQTRCRIWGLDRGAMAAVDVGVVCSFTTVVLAA